MKTHWLLCPVFLLFLSAPVLAQNQVLELDGEGAYVQLPTHISASLGRAVRHSRLPTSR